MNLSNSIAQMILKMLDQDGSTEIQRNEFAQLMGCVPSQINYVLSSRFTPEQGYIVESRRGGGGYIRIRRVNLDKGVMLMHVVNNIGRSLDEQTCRAHVTNLTYSGVLEEPAAKLILAATSDICFRALPQTQRDEVRASVFKQLLLALN
ncbi:MAG: CtsR family transcriptional regulator [Clostridia bacterium]|nr:CtsR family transcriptional regulator [Clostridia bacterium]